tara:strand:- start:14 stop:607 length:594 start_codon:yes stop_codon:yes gene_type:complete
MSNYILNINQFFKIFKYSYMKISEEYKYILQYSIEKERLFLKRLFSLYRHKYYSFIWPYLGYMKKGMNVFFDSEKANFVYCIGKSGYEQYYNTDEKRKRYWIHPYWHYCYKTYSLKEHIVDVKEHFTFRDKIYDIVSYYYLNNLSKLYNHYAYNIMTLSQITLVKIIGFILLKKYKTSKKELYQFIKNIENGKVVHL